MTAETISVAHVCGWCGTEISGGRFCTAAHRLKYRREYGGATSTARLLPPVDITPIVESAAAWAPRRLCRNGFDRLPVAVQIDTCITCPVMTQCRDYADALEAGLPNTLVDGHPVYGAETGRDRIRRRTGGPVGHRAIGRPAVKR